MTCLHKTQFSSVYLKLVLIKVFFLSLINGHFHFRSTLTTSLEDRLQSQWRVESMTWPLTYSTALRAKFFQSWKTILSHDLSIPTFLKMLCQARRTPSSQCSPPYSPIRCHPLSPPASGWKTAITTIAKEGLPQVKLKIKPDFFSGSRKQIFK